MDISKYERVPEVKFEGCNGCAFWSDMGCTEYTTGRSSVCRSTHTIYKLKAEGNMKKSDLKTGMRVKTRKGHYAIVLIDTMSQSYLHDFPYHGTIASILSLSNYNADLTYEDKSQDEFDIVAVWKLSGGETLMPNEELYRPSWERNQTHTISIDGEQRTVSHESLESLKDIFDTLE